MLVSLKLIGEEVVVFSFHFGVSWLSSLISKIKIRPLNIKVIKQLTLFCRSVKE